MDIGDILGIAGSAATGGIFGLVGVALKMGAGWLQKRQELEEKRLDQVHELQLIEKQSQLRVVEAEIESRIARDRADENIKTASYNVFTDTSNVYKWVASVVVLMRPTLTLLLWGLVAWVAYKIMDMRGTSIIDGKDLMAEIVNNITFCAVAATLWWFGDRPPSKR